jgi:hypothetical protein
MIRRALTTRSASAHLLRNRHSDQWILNRLLTFIHILAGIALTGLALYWSIMVVAVRQRFSDAEARELLASAGSARWPHVVVPFRFRLPLPWVFWIVLVVLAATGFAVADVRFSSGAPLYNVKLVLVGAVALLQIALTRRLIPPLAFASFALVLIIVALSGLMVR